MMLTILNYGFTAVFMLSIVVVAEITINFKRPYLLKALFLLLTFCFLWRSLATLYTTYAGYNRWIVELPNSLLGAVSLCLFSVIYQYKVRWYIIVFGISLVLTQLFVFIFYSYFQPVPVSVSLADLPVIGTYIKGLKTLLVIFSICIVALTFSKIKKKYRHQNIYFNRLKAWANFFLAVACLLAVGQVINSWTDGESITGQFIFLAGNYCALLVFLFRPKFLNRTNLRVSLGDHFTKNTNPALTDVIFMEFFFNKAYYLNKEASVEGLSRQLNISSEAINEFIYRQYGTGFTDLVNKHRIAYFIDLASTGKFSHYTIDALAQKAGFSSRHHLYKPFKKFHGGTPSDFIRSVAE